MVAEQTVTAWRSKNANDCGALQNAQDEYCDHVYIEHEIREKGKERRRNDRGTAKSYPPNAMLLYRGNTKNSFVTRNS